MKMHKITKPETRRAIYYVIAAVLAALVASGLITEEQFTSWTDIVEKLFVIIGSIALTFARNKTHPGSDDPTTKEDVEAAFRAVQAVYQPPVESAAASIQNAVTYATDSARHVVDDELESARQAYRDATRRE